MHIQDVYLKRAQHCEQLADQLGEAAGKQLRLREARDWRALASAQLAPVLSSDDMWASLQQIATMRNESRALQRRRTRSLLGFR